MYTTNQRSKLLLFTCLISTIKADIMNDIPTIINDKIASAGAASATTLAQVAASNPSQQEQLLQIFSSLTGAIKLSFSFFKYLFSLLFKCMTTVFSPLVWLTSNLWSNFVTKPFDLFMHVAHVLYPVTLFCIAAVCCGLFIGGCAGFAAEAFSSILISATWGPQPAKIKQLAEEEEVELMNDDNSTKLTKKRMMEQQDTDDEELYEEEEEEAHVNYPKSTASSIWETSSSFFGVHPHHKKNNKSEKEPLVQKPRVEMWRDSISSSTSTSSSVNNTPPVLIRRMKLSSTTKKSRDNSWEWDEDDDDIYHQRPSSSSSSKNKHM